MKLGALIDEHEITFMYSVPAPIWRLAPGSFPLRPPQKEQRWDSECIADLRRFQRMYGNRSGNGAARLPFVTPTALPKPDSWVAGLKQFSGIVRRRTV